MVRPSKFTPELCLSILGYIREGNSIEVAAQACGIDPSTYYKWQQKANAGDKKFTGFFENVKMAVAEAETANVAVVQRASEKSWQAAAWWLERRHADRWARRDEYKREEERPTSIKVIIKGEEEEDDNTAGDRKDIQLAQSPT